MLAEDVKRLAALLAGAEGCSAAAWVDSCSRSREANMRMVPCVKFDVVNGESSCPQFFMVRRLHSGSWSRVVCGGGWRAVFGRHAALMWQC